MYLIDIRCEPLSGFDMAWFLVIVCKTSLYNNKGYVSGHWQNFGNECNSFQCQPEWGDEQLFNPVDKFSSKKKLVIIS